MSKILKKSFFGEKVPFLTNSQNFDNKLKNQKNMKNQLLKKTCLICLIGSLGHVL